MFRRWKKEEEERLGTRERNYSGFFGKGMAWHRGKISENSLSVLTAFSCFILSQPFPNCWSTSNFPGFYKKKIYLFSFHLQRCFACTMCTQCLRRSEEAVSSPRTGATESCELPCGCWELDSRPPKEQSVLSVTDPPLQPLSVSNPVVCLR